MPNGLDKTLEKSKSELVTAERRTDEAPRPQAPILEAEGHAQAAPLVFEPTEVHPLNDTAPPQPVIQAAVAQKTGSSAPPQPVQQEPALEGAQQLLGGLADTERHQTFSDIERMAAKQRLQNTADLDLKNPSLSKFFLAILMDISDYAAINATAAQPDLVLKENELLQGIRQRLRNRFDVLNEIWARGEPQDILSAAHAAWANRKSGDAELNLALKYQNIFNLSVNGLLQTPPASSQTEKLEDLTAIPLSGRHPQQAKATPPSAELNFRDESKGLLFPHEPSISDIRQGGLGDCYLLAGLSAIVNQNPQLIKDCMRDNGDGTVTVRFFHKTPAAGAGAPQTITHYVTVKKLAPKNEEFASGCLWVQMIERAYAASGLHLSSQAAKPAAERSYQDIAGGGADSFIFEIIGKDHSKTIPLVQSSHIDPDLFTIARMNILAENPHISQTSNPLTSGMELLLGNTPVGKPTLQRHVPAGAAETPEAAAAREAQENAQFARLQEAYVENFIRIEEICQKIADTLEPTRRPHSTEGITKTGNRSTYTNKIMTKNELLDLVLATDIRLFPDSVGDLAAKEALFNQILALAFDQVDSTLHNAAFSQAYDAVALNCYESIEEGVKTNKIITAGSFKFVPDDIRGADGKNAEHVVEGLAEGHAYTVLGVKTVGTDRFVKLRNPWGTGTREYLKAPDGTITRRRRDEGTEGIFLMELNEFVSTFSNLDFN